MQGSINRLLDMADSNVIQDGLSQSRSVDEKVPHLSHEEWPQWVVKQLRPRITTYFPEMEGIDCAIACVSMGGDYAKTFKLDITGMVFGRWCSSSCVQYSDSSIQVLWSSIPWNCSTIGFQS